VAEGIGFLGKAGRVLGFVGKAAVAIPVAYHSFMVGTELRQGHGWAALKHVGLLAWDLTPGPLLLAGGEARQSLIDDIRRTHDPKTAEEIIKMSCLYPTAFCRQ
jgi:hypothetical protein